MSIGFSIFSPFYFSRLLTALPPGWGWGGISPPPWGGCAAQAEKWLRRAEKALRAPRKAQTGENSARAEKGPQRA